LPDAALARVSVALAQSCETDHGSTLSQLPRIPLAYDDRVDRFPSDRS
jgi:hypothetical protein